MFDPFVYLGLLAASTERIALGVASIVLPLRHPAHVAKAAPASICFQEGDSSWVLPQVTGQRSIQHSTYPSLIVAIDFVIALTISGACGRTRRYSRISIHGGYFVGTSMSEKSK